MRRVLRAGAVLGWLLAGCGGETPVDPADASGDRAAPADLVEVASDAPVDAAAGDVVDVASAEDVATDAAQGADISDAGDPPPPPLTVTRVAWNATGANLGAVQAVAEDGDLVAVYTDQGLRVLVAGAVAATDGSVRAWRTAITAAAADGSAGSWILGVDGSSRVHRVRDRSTLEDVTSRLALTMRDLRSAARVSDAAVAFGGVGAFAVLRGSDVTVWNDPDFAQLVGGGERVASTSAEGVKVFDLATRRAVRYAIEGVTGAALTRAGSLVVTVGSVLYEQNERGELAPRVTHPAPLRGVTVSGENAWLVADGRLALWDGFRVRTTADVPIGAGARMIPARDGGLWVIEAGALSRYALVVDPEEQRWNTAVRGVFATHCTPCHLPGGTAGIDLSTRCAWAQRREAIRTQVVERMLMPPPPAVMPQTARDAIAAYLASLPADACGGPIDAGAPMDVPRDVGADVRMDAGADVRADVPADARADVRMDAGADVRTDAGADVRMDGGADVRMDAGADVRMDAGADVRTDAGADVRTDAGADVRTDAGADVRTDVPRDTGAPDAGPATYAQVQAIFDRDCVRCHGSSGALNLTSAVSYGNLVNVAAAGGACAASGMDRVVPGDPAMSLLYRKVAGTQGCGNRMPNGAAALSASDVDLIRRWIAAGAPR